MRKNISETKSELMEQRVNDCEGDQKCFLSHIQFLIGSKKCLSSTIHMFLSEKINTIKMEFPLLETYLLLVSSVHFHQNCFV